MTVGLAWGAYYAVHSLLASDRAKGVVNAVWPRCAPWYRFSYNAIAIALLVAPIALTIQARGTALWAWDGPAGLLADVAAGLAVLGFLGSLFAYDLGTFFGLRAAGSNTSSQSRLRISTFHRFVRHPWYFFGLVILWTRDMDPALLATVVVTTAYFIIGSRLEESRLIREHGDRYRVYRRAVAGLLPLPWRILSAERVQVLETPIPHR